MGFIATFVPGRNGRKYSDRLYKYIYVWRLFLALNSFDHRDGINYEQFYYNSRYAYRR